MAVDKDLLQDYRVGVQRVADSGQWGHTFYIFEANGKLMSTNNINGGVGKLIETITARPPSYDGLAFDGKGPYDPLSEGSHGLGNNEPADYSVNYEKGSTL